MHHLSDDEHLTILKVDESETDSNHNNSSTNHEQEKDKQGDYFEKLQAAGDYRWEEDYCQYCDNCECDGGEECSRHSYEPDLEWYKKKEKQNHTIFADKQGLVTAET